jgi:hypothetical protein
MWRMAAAATSRSVTTGADARNWMSPAGELGKRRSGSTYLARCRLRLAAVSSHGAGRPLISSSTPVARPASAFRYCNVFSLIGTP